MSSQEGAAPSAPVPETSPQPSPSRSRVALALAVVVIVAGAGWRLTRPAAPAPGVVESPAAAAEAPAEVLAETIGEEGHLAIAVVSLDRVAADTLELRVAVTNTSPAGSPALDIAQRFSADGPDQGTLAEVYLADLSHERKLFVLRDDQNAPLGSRDTTPLGAGERRVLWARYPAPKNESEVVVHVPHADPMPNVPIGPR